MANSCLVSLVILGTLYSSNVYAGMTFDECAALNKGDSAQYVETWIGWNGKTIKVKLEKTPAGITERSENANVRYITHHALGYTATTSTGTWTTEFATGEVKKAEKIADYGTDLETVIGTFGETRYEQTQKMREIGGKWIEPPRRPVIVTVKENGNLDVGGCSIATRAIKVQPILSDGKLDDSYELIIYAPTAMITFKWSSFYSGKESIMRRLIDLDPVH